MSATATSLSPEDNRELLEAVAAAFDASREGDQRGLQQAKREVALALAGHPVLIAVSDGRPSCEPGPSGGVMLAFSDSEAASAWARSRHPAAPPSELASTSELAAGGASRKLWLQWLAELGANSVALNPAGPLGSVVHEDELRTTRPRLLRRGAARADHPWLDVSARETERARAGRLLETLTEAIGQGDRQAFGQIEGELSGVNEIGSLLWAAELQVLSGRRQLAEGNAKDGLYQMIYGSFGWGRFGDPYRCTDGLIEAGGLLLERRDSAPQDDDWQASYLSELCDVLARVATGYRDQDVTQLLAAAPERR
ncbi:MAG TPA: hypothetical protein VGF93_00440 [Solirubrobacteraceae bacterium]|jgi:hypothetical protein